MRIIDARGQPPAKIDNIHRQYPPSHYYQIGTQYSHTTTPEDIREFQARCEGEGAVAMFISEYGLSAYIPIKAVSLATEFKPEEPFPNTVEEDGKTYFYFRHYTRRPELEADAKQLQAMGYKTYVISRVHVDSLYLYPQYRFVPQTTAGAKEWYLGEYWDFEYSTAEVAVYRSADRKKRLYIYWDGKKEVRPVSGQVPQTVQGEIQYDYRVPPSAY